MSSLTQIWGVRVERGPNCLVLQLQAASSAEQDELELADRIWTVLEKHFVYRVVLEMDQVDHLSDYLMRELIALSHRLRTREGMLRLCGLSNTNRHILREACLDGRLPSYGSRREAMLTSSTTVCADTVC